MEFVSKLIKGGKNAATSEPSADAGSLQDGAIDTLGAVVKAMGELAFPTDDGKEVEDFREQCEELVRHVENGAPAPLLEIDTGGGSSREWGKVRRFFRDRRRNEYEFVTERLTDYRAIVDDLVGGIREIGQRDLDMANCVNTNLKSMKAAVATGILAEIETKLNETIRDVSENFVRQKRDYESRINELNQRMNKMREDLVSAREQMKRDSLTGVYNRRAFDTAIIHSLNLNFILNQPVTVILLDLDFFKEVNDTHGHTGGDAVLREFGNMLSRTFVRKNDIVARYGGDEFAVILADTTPEVTEMLLERFHKKVEEARLTDVSKDLRISCSTGYTSIAPGDTVEVLINRVDQALYQSKEAGRGRYHFGPPPKPTELLLAEA